MLVKLLILTILGGGGYITWNILCGTSQEPSKLPLDQWWGPGKPRKTDESIRPFKIQFTDEMITDLRQRLDNHRPLTPPLEGVSMEYGMNTKQLEEILQYWSKEYNFKEREKFLNQYPQYKTNIQGLDIHFIRVKPESNPSIEVVPLLLLHGWPGSAREFYELIPLLSTRGLAFDVIVPSLPGYGFSDPAVRPGLGPAQIAVIMRNLMHRLGHKNYYVQGGDWGSMIGSYMSTMFPNEVLGYHANMAFIMNKCATVKNMLGALIPSLIVEESLVDRMYPLSKIFSFIMRESGYMHIQYTKPDTVGVGLSDSPSGLAAYILEKFASWTVKDTKMIPSHLSKDGLIDNLMFYWVPNSITTSMRLYADNYTEKNLELNLDSVKTSVPSWFIQAKHELLYYPTSILKTKYMNVLNNTALEIGGHFMAFELPEVLAADVVKAVTEFRKWHQNKKQEKKEL